jgi:hypothetical protein
MEHISSCAECQRLWHEYSVATAEHISLDNKLSIAALRHDEATVRDLAPDVEAAVMRRSAAREAIKAHEASVHPPSAEAASA